MSRVRVPFGTQIRKWLLQFPDLVYDGTTVKCLPCETRLAIWTVSYCRYHVCSKRHIENQEKQWPYLKFLFDLIFMLGACELPSVLPIKQLFCVFWNKHVPIWKLPRGRIIYRKFQLMREMVENHIKSKVANQKVWITIDECADIHKKRVINVLIRTMKCDESSVPYLIASKKLKNVTADIIAKLVEEAIVRFGIKKYHVLMLVTESTVHMLETGKSLKSVFPKLLHVTCMLQMFYFVEGQLRDSYPDIDKLISTTKLFFDGSLKRTQIFQKSCPGIPEPPDTITTRSKTWLESVFYYHKYFDQIKSVITKMDASDKAINTTQELFENPQVRNNLYILHNNYISLLNAIKQLQSNSVSLSVSLSLVDSVKEQLQTVMDASGILASKMLCDTLKKNPDYNKLCLINQYLKNQNDGFSVDHKYFRYASITCEDVDHSILRHTSAFASQQKPLKETTIETLLMFQVYSHSHPSLCQQ